MPQVNIVNDAGVYYREYQIEPGDRLSTICLRAGQRDWRAVYDHPKNAAFRARFPDPDQIDYVNSVNLFIPLPGDSAPAKRRRGVPIGDFFIARILDEFMVPIPGVDVRVVAPGEPHEGNALSTDANGEIILTNLKPGEHFVVTGPATPLQLMPAAEPDKAFTPTDVDTTYGTHGVAHPMEDVKLERNALIELVGRPMYLIVCPMCGRTIFTVSKAPGAIDNECPHDHTNLTDIEDSIVAAGGNWLPSGNQNPLVTPNGLVTRGQSLLSTSHGDFAVHWDESRFVDPSGGDYMLWATHPKTGAFKSIDIIGRSTWGAGAPKITLGPIDIARGATLVYDFHDTPKLDPASAALLGLSPNLAYTAFGIPSNELLPLRNVLRWITVHHSKDPPQNSTQTVKDIQADHQAYWGTPGENPDEPYSDIGYHFVIDGDGKIYEGRPLGLKPSQVGQFNGGVIGIVLAGEFHVNHPTTAQINALDELVFILAWRFDIKDVGGHRDREVLLGVASPTECPGTNLEPHVHSVLRTEFPGPP